MKTKEQIEERIDEIGLEISDSIKIIDNSNYLSYRLILKCIENIQNSKTEISYLEWVLED